MKYGNECTGDISAVVELLDSTEFDDGNWIKGVKGKFEICAKVFSVPSDFGIQNGRISKIQICDVSQPHWGFEGCYMNYDRGWDITPTTEDAFDFLNQLLEAFGDDTLSRREMSEIEAELKSWREED